MRHTGLPIGMQKSIYILKSKVLRNVSELCIVFLSVEKTYFFTHMLAKTNKKQIRTNGGGGIKKYVSTIILAAVLFVVSVCSLFIGVMDADLASLMQGDPEVIFIGGRLASSYDALSEIAPVVYLSTDVETGVVKSVTKNAGTIASMFGLEDEVKEKTAGFDERIEALAEKAKGHTALVGMTTSGSFNLMGNDGRCSIIGVEIGFDNLTAAESTSTHGNEASFETVVEKNPEYIFVMDRDQAIGADGAQTAKEIMENELVMQTDAYKNGKIIYLEHPAVWYTAEGGITALDVMLSDLEESL